jgi:hypothetical protein
VIRIVIGLLMMGSAALADDETVKCQFYDDIPTVCVVVRKEPPKRCAIFGGTEHERVCARDNGASPYSGHGH